MIVYAVFPTKDISAEISRDLLNAKIVKNIGYKENPLHEKALMVVASMERGTEVYIGNEYDIVDENGLLCGYSFGYFIQNEPYGYAIYNLENQTISEFVYIKGIENLYLSLSESIDDDVDSEVDTEDIANGLLSGEPFEYYVIDTDGDVKSNFNGNKYSLKKKNLKIEKIFKYLGKTKYRDNQIKNPIQLYSQKSIFDVVTHPDDLPPVGKIRYNQKLVSGYGNAMISQDFIIRKYSKYACGIVAAFGGLRRLGLSDELYTYNYLWDNSKVGDITYSYDTNYGKMVQFGGSYIEDTAEGINKYLKSKNYNYAAYYWGEYSDTVPSHRATFSDFKTWVDCDYSSIVAMRVHAMSVLGYYSYTAKGLNYYDNYLVVADGWDTSPLKYINYIDVQESDDLDALYIRSRTYK